MALSPEQIVRNTMQWEMDRMPWDGSGPIDSLDKTIQYFATTYGPQGISYQEIASRLSDAYHYNGVPETGYAPATASKTSRTSGGGSVPTGPSQAEIAAYNAKVEADYADTIRKAERDKTTQLQKYQDTLQDLGQSEKQLGSSRDEGISSNTSYFSNIAPDAYQSQISRYNTKVQDAYKQGMETTGRNKQRVNEAVGSYEAEYQDYIGSLQRQKQWDISNYGKSSGAQGYSSGVAQPYQEAQNYNPQSMAAWQPPQQGGQAQPANKGFADNTWDWLNKVYKTGNIF